MTAPTIKVDLRSDTVTKPTPGMLEAMMNAEVGDDVFGEDPSVNHLEQQCAQIFGSEAGIFCPSGTMTNQIGINVLSNPYEEVICYKDSHIYKYEGGGVSANSGLSIKLLSGDRGRISLEDVLANINPDDIHYPVSSIVSLENTVNKGGGSYYTLADIARLSEGSREKGLKVHLDGARVFNALVETGDAPSSYGQYFDTISVCLSKGLGAPVGSVLVGKKEYIKKARRMRKAFGGGMRQAGFLAAAGIYALNNHVNRLKEDHIRARAIAEGLRNLGFVSSIMPVDTNILIFELAEGITTEHFLAKLEDKDIYAVAFGPREIRMVTHLDFDDDMLTYTIDALKKLSV